MKKIILILSMLWGVAHAQILLNSDIMTAAQRSVDGKQYRIVSGKHVPYDNASQFLITIPSTRRHVGEIAYIKNGAGIETWHFVGGIADSNFIVVANPNYLQYPLRAVNDSTAGFYSDSIQVYSSGSTLAVSNRANVVVINPGTTTASLTITLPDTAAYNNTIEILFGGTIDEGDPVITSLTIEPGDGQTILQPAYTEIESGTSLTLKYVPSLSKWYVK